MPKDIVISVDNDQFPGTLLLPEKLHKKNPAVLLMHGWQSTQKRYVSRAEALTKLGYICLTFTRRDYREATGAYKSLSPFDHLRDTIAAYDFLAKQKGVDRGRISVLGASYGAYLAALLAKKRNVYSLVLRVPALYPDEKFMKQKSSSFTKEDYQKRSITSSNNMALNAITHFNRSICIIESENDEVIPHETIEKYIEAANDNHHLTHKLMQGANHSLRGTKEDVWQKKFTQLLLEWFSQLR